MGQQPERLVGPWPTTHPSGSPILTYRGKPHVGGQGVYTRHLAKALVDLGHHVEVLGGQPYPILDERVPLIELPSLDIYNDHFPMRQPGPVGAEELEGRRSRSPPSRRHLPRAARLLHAGLGPPPPPPGRVRHRPGQPVPRLRPAPHRAPARHPGPRHDPPPDHRRPPPRDRGRRELVQAAHAAPLVRLRRHADRGRPPARSGSSRCRRTPSRTSSHDHKVDPERMAVVPVGVDVDLFKPLPEVAARPGPPRHHRVGRRRHEGPQVPARGAWPSCAPSATTSTSW